MTVINGTAHASKTNSAVPKEFKILANGRENAFFVQVDDVVFKMDLNAVSNECTIALLKALWEGGDHDAAN